ncbi:MAG: hypothetical protein QXO32_04745 [Candidatus Bathyarchaeia archaeon]
METGKLFTDEELENILFPSKVKFIYNIKKKIRDLINDYPLQTLGLAFAFGLLLGIAFSNPISKGNREH